MLSLFTVNVPFSDAIYAQYQLADQYWTAAEQDELAIVQAQNDLALQHHLHKQPPPPVIIVPGLTSLCFFLMFKVVAPEPIMHAQNLVLQHLRQPPPPVNIVPGLTPLCFF